MRNGLEEQSGQRKKFRAIFNRTGRKKNYLGHSEDTILLRDIVDIETGKIVSDHVWFNFTRGFEDAGLTPGVIVEFEARIKNYSKGYVNSRYQINNQKQDYKLANPTKIRVVKE